MLFLQPPPPIQTHVSFSYVYYHRFRYYSDVCTKYQEAAKIVNLALQGLVGQCKVGAKVLDLCEFGHSVITTAAQKLFTKKKPDGSVVERGVAFPVCISVNDVVCNYSPLAQEERVSFLLRLERVMRVCQRLLRDW